MPTTLKKSLVQGAQYEVTEDTRRLIVPCMLKTVDIASMNDMEVLVNCEAALYAEHGITIKSPLPNYPNMLLWRIRVQPVVEKVGKDVWVDLEYLWEPDEFLPTMYTVRDSTVAIQRETYYIPGTNITVKAKFDVETGANVEGGGTIDAVTQDLCKMRLWMPARSISIAALRYGRPAGGAADKIRYVNSADWPVGSVHPTSPGGGHSPLGTPILPAPQEAATANSKGFWMLSDYSTEWYQNSGQTLVRATATTQVLEDWSIILFVENRETGKRPFGALKANVQEAFLAALRGPAYSYGEIVSIKGAVRIGPYPTTNFHSLFGF